MLVHRSGRLMFVTQSCAAAECVLHVPRVAIDQTNLERLFVAVLGHRNGPNTERGSHRLVNGK